MPWRWSGTRIPLTGSLPEDTVAACLIGPILWATFGPIENDRHLNSKAATAVS